MIDLIRIIESSEDSLRNTAVDPLADAGSSVQLLDQCRQLDQFRRKSGNLYHRVRALLFLYTIHRYHLPSRPEIQTVGKIPFRGYQLLLERRFAEAIDHFLSCANRQGWSDGICSALAAAYHRLAFQTLADQVRRSVRSVLGNQWMFRMGHPQDQPLRIRAELREPGEDGTYPLLSESTPVRMDLSHSAWSDIFFLGMDFPEGARVLNASVDLGVHGRDAHPLPPLSAAFRTIDEPVLRLTSCDLGVTDDLRSLAEVFDFGKDHLGLLKAAVIAAGIVPPGLEGSGQQLSDLLAGMAGRGKGIEVVSQVRDIPKGSRLAVSTNLLGSLISVCMRATGQTRALEGPLEEPERRVVLARALLGEWLGGSGGGWQDSGGIWPGIKLIEGAPAARNDPEFGISQGRLMPTHRVLDRHEVSNAARAGLQESLILVHGGMAQNVGPILEMVTEKYLLRSPREWAGRLQALDLLKEILNACRQGDLKALGRATTANFKGPIQSIIPWATNAYTESIIAGAQESFGEDFWGFCMLGGMSGGGMGFFVAPHRQQEAKSKLLDLMQTARHHFRAALPFAMEPVVFDYAVNETGTTARLLTGNKSLLPLGYYAVRLPKLLRQDQAALPRTQRMELDKLGATARTRPEMAGLVQSLFDSLIPRGNQESGSEDNLAESLGRNGFDPEQHEMIRKQLKEGLIGLAQNRLRADTEIVDVEAPDVSQAESLDLTHSSSPTGRTLASCGWDSLARGEVAIVSLAAGAGSRWTQGAGICKALHPFCKLGGKHRTFLDVHLAKSRRLSRLSGANLPHVFTTSYLTHEPIESYFASRLTEADRDRVLLSPGRSVGQRFVPTERDLHFLWEETAQQILDEQQQKVRESVRAALVNWAKSRGEASDYTENVPLQCMHPVGHFFEMPNLFRNGVLAKLLQRHPALRCLLLHNIDTTGVNADPRLLEEHLAQGACLTFEVIARRLEDRGGGLAKVNGRTRILEGLALPREEDEFELSYYNSMSTWIDLDRLLEVFFLDRGVILEAGRGHKTAQDKIVTSIREVAAKLPTYVAIKEVKRRWGHGQEDIFPVAQFEKLWSDLTMLPEVSCRYIVVPRSRGQQLKDQAQLDGWLRDGSAAYVESLCDWD